MTADEVGYSIRPSFKEKFRPALVKPLISQVLAEHLADKTYNPESTAQWTREISDEIKNKLKTELSLPRYKFVVQVVIGEQRGEGVRCVPPPPGALPQAVRLSALDLPPRLQDGLPLLLGFGHGQLCGGFVPKCVPARPQPCAHDAALTARTARTQSPRR